MNKYGLTEETYENLLKDCSDKVGKINDMDWLEIATKYHIDFNPDTCRKAQQPSLLGGAFIKQYYEEKQARSSTTIKNEDEYIKKLEKIKEDTRKERIKLQTANVERNRIDRAESRQELFYEYIGSVKEKLPLPEFQPLFDVKKENEMEYLLCLSDLHYGATFISEHNEYSPEIFRDRLEYLSSMIYDFILEKKLNKLHVACLGDTLQGLIRLSDLKLNDSAVVKSTVEICRLLASFLNSLSAFADIEYYHVPSANHTQIRPLGTKASEIANEDLEYVIGNYIMDLCASNERINVHLADEGKEYIEIDINNFEILAMHGHQLKNIENSLKDLSIQRGSIIDYLILGHFHAGKEIPVSEGCTYDTEIHVCPSFVGSDPYSDSIMKGSKASVKIFGFDYIYGITETKKIILN